MNNYNYEFVQYNEGYDAKIFMTAVEHSNFHWHYEYEFVFVLKGAVKVNTTPEPVTLREGELILLNSKVLHEVQKTEEDNIVLFVQISPVLFQLEPNEKKNIYFYLNSKDRDMEPEGGFEKFVRSMAALGCSMENEKKNKNARFRTKALLYGLAADCFERLVFDIYQKVDGDKESEKQNRRLMALIHYIEENFRDEYVLENMNHSLGLSEKSIHRQLKMGIGLSAKELVTECRLKEAKRMLKFTDKSISMIADVVGFNSDKTFYRVFKQHVKVTPKEYRRAGETVNADDSIKGYLGTNWKESARLLQKYLKGCEADELF